MTEIAKEDDLLICYVLMRTDLDSLNPGKAMAQAHHNYGALKFAIRANLTMQPAYIEWQRQTDQDYGTVITLGGNEGEIQRALDCAKDFRSAKTIVAGWVWDKSYPVRDGAITHAVRLNTNAFVFGFKSECADIISHLEYHP